MVELLRGQDGLIAQLRAELMEARKAVGHESSGSGSKPVDSMKDSEKDAEKEASKEPAKEPFYADTTGTTPTEKKEAPY